MKISLRDQALLFQRLAALLEAGISLLEALRLARRQAKDKRLRTILDSLARDVEEGRPLATGLAKYRADFGELAVNLVDIGERSGTLDECLARLAAELRQSQALRRKLVSASIYPLFLVAATLGITLLLVIYVFPKLLPMFQGLGFELPWTTRLLIAASGFLIRCWPWLLLGLGLMVAAATWALRQPLIRERFDRVLLASPLAGGLIRRSAVATSCRVAGLMLRSGVSVDEACRVAARTVGHSSYRRTLTEIGDRLAEGEPLRPQVERQSQLFPSVVAELVAVGERVGRLDTALENLARLHEEELDSLTRDLATLFEPLLLAVMGLVVGFVAISIITPIYALTQHLNA